MEFEYVIIKKQKLQSIIVGSLFHIEKEARMKMCGEVATPFLVINFYKSE
jgi:hypothetical protein